MVIGMALVGVFAVLGGWVVGTCSTALRDWISSKAELNRAQARQLQRQADGG